MQFVRGLKDNDVRGQLLQKETSTFKESVQAAISFESSRLESSIISNPKTAAVLKLTGSTERKMPEQQQYGSKGPTKKTERYHTVRSTFDQLCGRCYRCGDKFHKADSCRYKDEFCNSCNKVGHLARVCMAKNRARHINQIEDNENVNDIDHATCDTYKIQMNGSDKFMVEVTLEGKPIQMELDTGAALSSISYKDYKQLNLSKKLFQTHVQLRTYTGKLIKPKGVVYVEFNFKDKAYFGKLYVIGQNVEPIFGRDWLREINLKIGDIRTIQENSCDLSKILTEFSDVFKKEIGCIPNEKVHLSLQEGCKPIFIKPRQVPYSLKGKVEDELNRLENAGIITKVNNAQWGTPIVPVVKPNGSVRICADYKTTINKVIQDDKHPIPRIEDIFAEMNGGKLFCTLDISNAYLHMQMDEESSNMQTISTEKGLYKVNRMMFGVKVAPSVWQRFMDRILQGISGVKCFFDDIIIQGSNYEETVQRLKLVLDKMREHDLRLNFEKCKFFQKRIAYLGHTIDENGLQKGSEKVKAIVEAKRPRDVNQLRSFIGLANYYNKFIPKLAEKLNPLNKLLQKGKKFEWTDECERSFESVKMDIAKDKTLIHYNPSLPLILSTDASPTGLGAVISHRLNDGTEKPIAFASRSLSKMTVVTDNGTQFTSTAFQNYLKENGICHRTCAPFHPSSNGQAERFVQTVKKGLNSMVGERGDIQTKIDALVTQLRKAPSSTTGMSAYKMMFGRDIRTKLNVMSDKTEWFRVEQRKMGRQFSVGQKVQARNYASKEKWRLGEIISRVGNVMYRIKMDNGLIWTRHTDQILPMK
ncbi:uncharacterized protein K02A2.6-like [Macrosteles quadrilineatus]|uniref:uncharacterized protein K02A2.6-like n=1 Tax=Macrosteles quadrilineatus TaxID=74068 RepID=UPI0023E2220F|nr:uncharacterized protein K02A2.6-like [Macrosteles quadrilineatus]